MYDYATRQEQLNIKAEIQTLNNKIDTLIQNNVTQLDSIQQVLSVLALAVCFGLVISIVRRVLWRR